jgi:two-component system sensor histidine kinase ChvG
MVADASRPPVQDTPSPEAPARVMSGPGAQRRSARPRTFGRFRSLLYLDRYRQYLIQDKLGSLAVQGSIFAAALGEAAVTSSQATGRDFLTALARPMVRRLARPGRLRAQLFAANGDLIADSRHLGTAGGKVEIAVLPPPPTGGGVLGSVIDFYDWIVRQFRTRSAYPPYQEHFAPKAEDYPELRRALAGEPARSVRMRADGHLVLSVAQPVQRYKQVLGTLLLSAGGEDIDEILRAARLDILTVVAVMLFITIALSLWLAGTIARPAIRLAAAANRVRMGRGGDVEIPDLTARGDEIGELSGALRDMTAALKTRMDAIESFAADVAHEIKNPLTSLRSAVETAARIEDPNQQRRLMGIILDDVQRLDRLISDISDASRLDAELSRMHMSRVDLAALLRTLAEVETSVREHRSADAPRIQLELPEGAELAVHGMEGRLGQVLRNLIANAESFSPPRGEIRIAAEADAAAGTVTIIIEDQGPGLPEGKLEAIFDRFYSERPESEKFGTHSGLGLSISKQIIEAHNGEIRAENISAEDGGTGARFVITLPASDD